MCRSSWTALFVVIFIRSALISRFGQSTILGSNLITPFVLGSPINNGSRAISSNTTKEALNLPYSHASSFETFGFENEQLKTASNELQEKKRRPSSSPSISVLLNNLQHSNLETTDHSIGQVKIKSRYKRQQDNCENIYGPALFGLRCDYGCVTEDGAITIKAFEPTKIYLIGRNLYSNLTVGLTPREGSRIDDCTHYERVKTLQLSKIGSNVAEVTIELPSPGATEPFYFCLQVIDSNGNITWPHQGSDQWLKLYVKQDFLPFYMKLITIACLLGLSGIFSGLNLGLMALDKNELQVIMKCGSEDEKRYARAIEPVRRRGNYLLCSILFSNTLVNSTISVFLEELSDGLIAIMTSTVLIVLFGEILPQAFCSRHGLAVGAKTVGLTYFCMVVTFPLSWPVSYCLDLALGEEIGHAYDRERLMEFIQVTRDINNLETDEVNIISGALKIKRIKISEVMTRIEDVYMLEENSVLDFDTIQAIIEKGYSRIPVHASGDRKTIVAVLFAKDLALVDPDDKTPVKTMIEFYNHPRMFVFEDTTLDMILNQFKTGTSHMAIVQRIIDDGERDPYYEITGIVTLEDVIEEIMQMEINDETDILSDNRRKRRRKEAQVRKDFSQFTNLGTGDSSLNVVTSQLCMATYQYLSTTVEPFTQKYLSESILQRLLSQRIFYKVRVEDDENQKRLYIAGEPADYFIMILEGRVHVVCGKENLVFDGGPFSFFGKAALSPPDYKETAVGAGTCTIESPSRDSIVKPIVSRHESIVKGISGQLSPLAKKIGPVSSGQESGSVAILTNSPSKHKQDLDKITNYFIPDYTVEIISNTSYLKVTRKDYLTALRATLVEREGALSGAGGDVGDEIEIISDGQTQAAKEQEN